MISFQLNSGREVSLVSFSFTFTYGGLLVGAPNEERNREKILKAKYPSEWGTRNFLVIQPSENEIKTQLKPICYCAWLESDSINSTDDTSDGSNLIVIWYGDSPDQKTINDILVSDLKNLDWDKHAENFNF